MKKERGKRRETMKQTQTYIKTWFLYWLCQGGRALKTGLDHNLKGLSGVWVLKMGGLAVCLD